MLGFVRSSWFWRTLGGILTALLFATFHGRNIQSSSQPNESSRIAKISSMNLADGLLSSQDVYRKTSDTGDVKESVVLSQPMPQAFHKKARQEQSIPNIYLGMGYNLLRVDPNEVQSNFSNRTPDSDILEISHSKSFSCPTQASCNKVRTKMIIDDSTLIDDAEKYNLQNRKSWSTAASSFSPSLLDTCLEYAGSASRGVKYLRDLFKSESEKVLLIHQTWQIHYDVVYKLDEYKSLTVPFLSDLCELPQLYTKHTQKRYFNFFDQWGTHVIVAARLGEKIFLKFETNKKDYLNAIYEEASDIAGFLYFNEKTYISVSSELTRKYSGLIGRRLKYTGLAEEEYTGQEASPYLLYAHLIEIPYFIDLDFVQFDDDCMTGVDGLRKSLYTALLDYFKINGYKDSTMKRSMAVKWSNDASFSLLKPKSGCPMGAETRVKMRKKYVVGDEFSRGLSNVVSGSLRTGMSLTFCTQMADPIDDVSNVIHWPAGSYCLFQSVRKYCPLSFHQAKVHIHINEPFDNDESSNRISIVKTEKGYEISFCCRNDGSIQKPLFLPAGTPLFLLPVSNTCQTVKSMRVEMHWIKWKTNNEVPASGHSTPFIEGKVLPRYELVVNTEEMKSKSSITPGFRLFVCYYFP